LINFFISKSFVFLIDECSKYGEVIKVVIYTEQQDEDDNSEQIVKIFVEFRTSKGKYCNYKMNQFIEIIYFCLEAEKAAESLHGRYFAGRMIKAELYDQTAYQADDLSG
jgi:poly(U)-binding-splicing factor PUF60